MKKVDQSFSYEVYDSIDQLQAADAQLLSEAREASKRAYAPYSKFNVGAAARLEGGRLLTGANQENASFPAGICAERVLLSTAASVLPGLAIESIAISYQHEAEKSQHPIAPCGICRQSLLEQEHRQQKKIRMILGGMEGKVFVINSAGSLLPLAFTGNELER
ncbi:MAG: cytidine deaminase [Chitinophagales bacterium]